MGFVHLRHSHWFHHKHLPYNPAHKVETDKFGIVSALNGLRVLGLACVSFFWVLYTLQTGSLNVAPVILIGLAVGCAHMLLPQTFHRAHLPSALYITFFGCLIANTLAGLAEFSSILGVDYLQVVSSRRIPEDLPVLSASFIDAFQPQDAFFYALAIAASFMCLKKRRNS